MKKRHFTSVAVALAAAAFATCNSVSAADFYKNKLIKIIVGSGAGGGYDTYSRLMGRHMGRHVPGNPKFVVQNKRGAGSVVAMNYVQNVLRKDGTAIAGLQREIALVQMMGKSRAQFEAAKLNWLGSLANEAGICAVATRTGAKVGGFSMAFEREFAMAGLGYNDTELQPAILNNTLGTKFKLVKGYPGTPQVHLAIQRGEVDGICQSWSSFKKAAGNFYTDGKIQPIVQMSIKPDPQLKKLGVPMVFDFVNEKHVQAGLTKEDVQSYLRLTFAAKSMGRPFALAAGVPAGRVKILRAGFNAMTEDPKFLAEAKKQKREIGLVTGTEIQQMVESMAAVPKTKLAKLEELLAYKGSVKKITFKMAKHAGKVTAVKRGGRSIAIDYKGKKVTAKVSGSRTKVTIDGKKAKRGAIKVGMNCVVVYPGPGSQAKSVSCKN